MRCIAMKRCELYLNQQKTRICEMYLKFEIINTLIIFNYGQTIICFICYYFMLILLATSHISFNCRQPWYAYESWKLRELLYNHTSYVEGSNILPLTMSPKIIHRTRHALCPSRYAARSRRVYADCYYSRSGRKWDEQFRQLCYLSRGLLLLSFETWYCCVYCRK